jgi:hypothetical protein
MVAGTGHMRGGLGIFPLVHGPNHIERWRQTGGPQRLTGPTRQWHRERERGQSRFGLLRSKYILNIENYFSFNIEHKIIQKK